MRTYLPLCFALLGSGLLNAQSTLYFEAFDNGIMTFDLNTTDMGAVGAGGYNKFIINNSYTGGSGTLNCLGFPFGFTVPSTAPQLAGISGSPASNYLHTLSSAAESSFIYSCCFLAADGFCFNNENIFSGMNTDISTIGYTSVSFSFWWLGVGGINNYGEVYYSTDGGNNWSQLTTPISQYKNQSVWTQTTITHPAFINQATLRFGFRFVNQVTGSAADPGFGVDDVRISGTVTSAPTLQTDSISGNPFCPGESALVYYTASGSYNAGNIFSAELSDSTGNFSNPTIVGSFTSTTSGTIAVVIPPAAALGNGYRVRVVSSSPVVISNDNGTDLTVSTVPSVSLGAFAPVCELDDPFLMYGGSPPGGDYLGTGITGNFFDPQTAGTGTFNIIYTFADFTGCSDSATNKITVNPVPDASFSGLALQYCNTDAPVNLVGAPSGGTFLGNGISANVFDPSAAGSGSIEIQYIFINQYACSDTAVQTTLVEVCSGMQEQKDELPVVYFDRRSSEIVIELAYSQSENFKISISDLMGRIISEMNVSKSNHARISTDYLGSGVYIASVKLTASSSTKRIFIDR